VADASTQLLGGLTWESLAADARPHRLKRGKHFRADVRELQRAAADAAHELGCAVRTVRDEFGSSNHYVWVQFADYALPLGAPCPRCGSHELLRTHEAFGRCPRCGARLLFDGVVTDAATEATPSEGRRRPGKRRRRMSDYDDVELTLDEEGSDESQERWYGRAFDAEGRPGLIEIVYPLHEGARSLDPEEPGEDLHQVRFWAFEVFERAVRLGVLEEWPPKRASGS